MDLGLEGKVVLITGGSKGIGLACARAFAAEGARVAIASRSQDNLDRAREDLKKEGVEAFAVAADLTRAEAATAMAAATEKALGPIDVLVNSAGTGGKRAQPTHLAGGAANAALMLVTVGWANALGKFGIRVNAINPASTYTGRVKQALVLEAKEQNISEAEALERLEAAIPFGRYGQPDEVAAVTVFLASAKASYVSGAVIPMDGAALPVI